VAQGVLDIRMQDPLEYEAEMQVRRPLSGRSPNGLQTFDGVASRARRKTQKTLGNQSFRNRDCWRTRSVAWRRSRPCASIDEDRKSS
jgi:hypothetical protein